jgi:hypothetical protein
VHPPETGFESETFSAETVTPLSALLPRTNAQRPRLIAEAPTPTVFVTTVFADSVTVVEPCGPFTLTVEPLTAETVPLAMPTFAG